MCIFNCFMTGLLATGKVMAIFLGGLCAVLAAALVLCVVLGILGGVFDFVTWIIGRRLAKSGREPKSRAWKIIARSAGNGKASV